MQIKRPLIMGVLNATPDSFFDKGAHFGLNESVKRGLQLIEEGADILDIGGASSNPKASFVELDEELRRTQPLIEALAGLVKVPISIDTQHFEIAKAAVEKGASLINDISGFRDPRMRELAASCKADLCVMHMRGSPPTMQLDPHYEEGVVEHILHFFEQQIKLLVQAGCDEARIILDPGIGFGKTVEHNLVLLNAIDRFKGFGLRVLIGASRKGFMTKILGKSAPELLAPTLAVHTFAALRGADIIRAHDVKEHHDALTVAALLTAAR